MKKLLKITALVLSLAFCLALGFACGGNTEKTDEGATADTCTVTVTKSNISEGEVSFTLKYAATASGAQTAFTSGAKIAKGSFIFVTVTNSMQGDRVRVTAKSGNTTLASVTVSGGDGNNAQFTDSLTPFALSGDVQILLERVA